MSIEVMTTVLNHSKATGRAKLVLLGIANHQGDQGAWPSISTLARYANASERSIMRDIQELEELGELIVERNAAPIRGQYRPNLYWVNVDVLAEYGSGVTDFEAGVTENDSGVTAQVVRGDTVVTQNVINPKEKLKEIYPQENLGERFKDYHFAKFWELYPKKVEKIDARKAFGKVLDKYNAKDVLDGVERLANDPNLPPKQFIPYPASWLRAGGWTNEPYPPREQTAEEKAERLAHQRRVESERSRKQTEALIAEMQETKKKSSPPPICQHGNTLVRCLTCLAESKRNT
jgi:hypothetical protein